MPYADRGTHRIHFEIVGDESAPTVLFVMGMGFSSRAWDEMPGRVVAAGYRVVTFDNRGTGRSETPSGFFRVADMADDAKAVLDAVGVERAHVFGVSMGGMSSLELVLRHPERVRSLALGCTYSGWLKSKKPALSITRRLLLSTFLGDGSLERVAPVLISDEVWRNERARFADWMTRVERAPTRVLVRQIAAVVRHDTDARLDRIDVPTLVMTGDRDRLVPPENSHVLASRIPRSTFVEVAGAGHCFPFEQPDKAASALVGHINGAEKTLAPTTDTNAKATSAVA